MAEMVEEAIEKSNKIAEYLKKNHAGQQISKVSIKLGYSLPQNKSTIVYEALKTKHGFQVERNFIVVPVGQ